MDNLEEMDKFLEKYTFPKLNQEERENLKRPVTNMEIDTVIRKLAANKSPGQTHEKMFNITHYQRNANQNHNEVTSHASQNDCYQKVYKQ